VETDLKRLLDRLRRIVGKRLITAQKATAAKRGTRKWRREMPIFISYSRQDSGFVDRLARNLALRRHNVWMDRWEMNVGDSLIDKIQSAITDSSAILVVLSRHSVSSEWCKKELNSGLMRELAERKVLLLPCVIDDCDIPLFLREKLYADFRSNPDEALSQLDDALLRITNRQQGTAMPRPLRRRAA
jgi:TIR domain